MSEDEPATAPEHPKKVSFREANLGPEPKRPPQRSLGFIRNRKRTVAITLVFMGVGSAGLIASSNHRADCEEAAKWGQQQPNCDTSTTNTGTHGTGGSSFFTHGYSSGGGSESASSVGRGGFGGTGSAHASAGT